MGEYIYKEYCIACDLCKKDLYNIEGRIFENRKTSRDYAKEKGWKKINGKWNCDKCLGNKSI
jgi:hypothetical protein